MTKARLAYLGVCFRGARSEWLHFGWVSLLGETEQAGGGVDKATICRPGSGRMNEA